MIFLNPLHAHISSQVDIQIVFVDETTQHIVYFHDTIRIQS